MRLSFEGLGRARRARRAAAELSERHPAPLVPWTPEYVDAHRAFVADLLDDAAALELFGDGDALPGGFGVGFDERVVEYPWLLTRAPRGRVLDAGSTLNHAHVLDRVLPALSSLTITTLAPESVAFPQRGVSYVFADLRALPFRDGWFDTVVCVSTLEHIGLDNSVYGSAAARASDPAAEADAAVRELRRVTRPGGRLLVTVPYGAREDHGWFRQFDRDDLRRLLDPFDADAVECAVFRYDATGWQRSHLDDAAGACYRDFLADSRPVEDRAAAARAVACLTIRV